MKRPIYVPDVSKIALLCSAEKTRSELAVPLMVRDEVVGVLDCQSENLDHFDAETTDLLTLFSTQASLALQNARLYSLERRRASQLEAINAIAQQTTAVPRSERTAHQGLLADSTCVSGVASLGFAERGRRIDTARNTGTLTPRFPSKRRCPATQELSARALSKSNSHRERRQASTDHVDLYAETASRMCIPLVSFGQTLGVWS